MAGAMPGAAGCKGLSEGGIFMGKAARQRPERLAEKLYQIREVLDLSQNEMLGRLGLDGTYNRAYVSFWENGVLEPPLNVLLRYARAYGISTDLLIDDKLYLPASRRKSRHPVNSRK
jgi:transcriptional regulator with XRE-family HTH domain